MQQWLWLVVAVVICVACGGNKSISGADGSPLDGTSEAFTVPDTAQPSDTPVNPTDSLEPGDAATLPDGAICFPGETQCKGWYVQLVCNETGSVWKEIDCPDQQRCDEDSGQCLDQTCVPDTPMGVCLSETTYEVCNETGTGPAEAYCDADLPLCNEGICKYKCYPGTQSCQGLTAIAECDSTGSAYLVDPDFGFGELCSEGDICQEYGGKAKCVLACAADLKSNTYIGCDYWAVDLDNIEGGQGENVAIVISNPNEFEDAVITIVNTSTAENVDIGDPNVSPMSQKTFLLPKGFDMENSSLSNRSFHIKSTAPVVAYQFNPLNAKNVWSNDASLLLPSNVASNEYIAMSWPQRPKSDKPNTLPQQPLRGFITVIAVEKKPTIVTVYPTAEVYPGPGLPAFIVGQPNTVLLEHGQVLNIESGGSAGGTDLTGTRIVADHRVTVFAGHECANIPLIIQDGKFKGTEFCDHIEQQMFPLETWGNEYVADAFFPRSPTQTDVWRVLAGSDQILITTEPPQEGAIGVALNQSQYIEFESADNFVITATGPISVGHYLKGSNYAGHIPNEACALLSDPNDPNSTILETAIGDPAFTLSVPTNQYRDNYIVLTPDNYVEHYINLIYSAGTVIDLDGTPVELPPQKVGNTDWNTETITMIPGVHHVSANQPIGITAYGYDCDVSYAYPGGLNLNPL